MKCCPSYKSETGIREIIYGLPNGPVDEKKYAIGGCCISDNDPTVKCIECGWKGEYADNMSGPKRQIKAVELVDISKMSDSEIEDYASTLWQKLTVKEEAEMTIPRNEKLRRTRRVYAEWSEIYGDSDDAQANDAYFRMYEEEMNKPYQPNQVTLEGSSLLGKANGVENFKVAHEKLSELRDKGRVKCYTRWCKACTIHHLQLEDDVTGHVLKISFPNVIALAKSIKIDWAWERPESDWAKKTGDPVKSFQSLVERNSKPVFYVRLISEKYIDNMNGW